MVQVYSNTAVNTPAKANNKILVPSDDGTRVIGVIRRGVFTKTNWHSRKHLCFKHDAIGIDKAAFQDYVLPHAEQIKCPDRDTGITYVISTADFKFHCIEDNLGWGVQLFCRVRYFKVEDNLYGQLKFNLSEGGQSNG